MGNFTTANFLVKNEGVASQLSHGKFGKLISWTSLEMANEFNASTVSSDQDVLK